MPVVHLFLAVRTLAIRAIEPHFGDRPVLRQQLRELRDVDVVVARRVAVRGMIAIPGRQIEPDAKVFGSAGIHELADDVALSPAKGTRCDGVRRRLRRPETEAVVMLGGEDHRPEAGVPRRARPLPGVERGGIEDRRRLRPIAPLAVREGVHPEVEEHRELVSLPLELRARWSRPGERRDRSTSWKRAGGE